MYCELKAFVFYSILLQVLVDCKSLPHFKHTMSYLPNNSFIFYSDIHDRENSALQCVTDNVNCCNNATVGGWRDERGEPVYERADGTTCLYVTRGDGVISLHRKIGCTSDHTSGLWRCDIPDSSGEMQSLYVYISFYIYILGSVIPNPAGKKQY